MTPRKQRAKATAGEKSSRRSGERFSGDSLVEHGFEEIPDSKHSTRIEKATKPMKLGAKSSLASDTTEEDLPRRQDPPSRALYRHVEPYTSDYSQDSGGEEDNGEEDDNGEEEDSGEEDDNGEEDNNGEEDDNGEEDNNGEEDDSGENLMEKATKARAIAGKASTLERRAREEVVDAKLSLQKLKDKSTGITNISKGARKVKDLEDKSSTYAAEAMKRNELAVEAEKRAKKARKEEKAKDSRKTRNARKAK